MGKFSKHLESHDAHPFHAQRTPFVQWSELVSSISQLSSHHWTIGSQCRMNFKTPGEEGGCLGLGRPSKAPPSRVVDGGWGAETPFSFLGPKLRYNFPQVLCQNLDPRRLVSTLSFFSRPRVGVNPPPKVGPFDCWGHIPWASELGVIV